MRCKLVITILLLLVVAPPCTAANAIYDGLVQRGLRFGAE